MRIGTRLSAGPEAEDSAEGGSGSRSGIPGLGEAGELQRQRSRLQPPHVHATIGLVGPMSNYATPPQVRRGRALSRPGRRCTRSPADGATSIAASGPRVPKLSGFCLLMTRAVYEAIGGLDERFGLGFFDDDDLAVRARRAGFELAVAHDLFVHHFGSRTFVGNGVDAEALLEENAAAVRRQVGAGQPRGRAGLRPWAAGRIVADEGDAIREDWAADDARTGSESAIDSGIRDSRSQIRVPPRPSAAQNPLRIGPKTERDSTMIVKDEETNLPRCPGVGARGSSTRSWSSIPAARTGPGKSRGSSAPGCSNSPGSTTSPRRGTRRSAHATGDYAFWLDADDVVDPAQRETLRALLDGLEPASRPGYVVRCACDPAPTAAAARPSSITSGCSRSATTSAGPTASTSRSCPHCAGPASPCDGPTWSSGIPAISTSPCGQEARPRCADPARGAEGPARRAVRAVQPRRDRHRAARLAEALGYLRRSLSRSAPSDSITRKLFALIARSHQMLGDTAAALRTCAEGLSLEPEDAELLFRKAVVHRHRGESAEAEQSWRRILGLRRPERFASVDMGIYGHLTRRNLAVLAAERGDPDEAARLWRDGARRMPRRPRGPRHARPARAISHQIRQRPSFAISTGSRRGCPIGMDSIPRPGDST